MLAEFVLSMMLCMSEETAWDHIMEEVVDERIARLERATDETTLSVADLGFGLSK